MKKLLALFIAATFIFASCSSNLESEDVKTPEKNYKVTFNVSNFDSDIKPLKAETHLNYLHYAIYEKESGNLVKTDTLRNGNASQINEEVPEGVYNIAIISAPTLGMLQPVLTPSNFYTDYCVGNAWTASNRGNQYIYYEKVSFTAGENNNVAMDVTLQPKWTEFDIEVTDADTYSFPETTNIIQCIVDPLYYGFGLADGVPTRSGEDIVSPTNYHRVEVDKFRTQKGLFGKIVAGSKNVTVKLVFTRESASEPSVTLGERIIYTGDIPEGKHITFKGKLGDTDSNNLGFKISLADLTDGGVIPFD